MPTEVAKRSRLFATTARKRTTRTAAPLHRTQTRSHCEACGRPTQAKRGSVAALSPSLIIGSFVGLIGVVFGSAVTALSWRLPRGASWASGRSRCPACNHPLGPLDLVPVLSWVLARGRCRYCRAQVSARYPLIELACGAWALLAWLHLGLVPELAPVLLWGWMLVALLVIDLDFKLLPDVLTLPGTVIGL